MTLTCIRLACLTPSWNSPNRDHFTNGVIPKPNRYVCIKDLSKLEAIS